MVVVVVVQVEKPPIVEYADMATHTLSVSRLQDECYLEDSR